MNIEQIDLKAYGHFTNRRLTLTGPANFHIICGQNEAGKTTLWRAISGALFGIPERTTDTFFHEPRSLRIGLVLVAVDGNRLAVMRRKGRINTLVEYDPATADETATAVHEELLQDWLGGLSKDLFRAMFSLDHDALVKGGEALAQGKGDAGESLFDAGAGLSSIHALRSTLDKETGDQFRPRASAPPLNMALSAYDNARRQTRDAAVHPKVWTAAKSAMDAASKDYEAAKAEQSQLHQKARRLERLSAILPDIAALKVAEQRIAELGAVPKLPSSAASDRIEAIATRDRAADAERTALARLDRRQAEMAAIRINQAILVDVEGIEGVHHATTTYRDAKLEFAIAESAIATGRERLHTACVQISAQAPAGEILQWVPEATQQAKVRALIGSGASLKAQHSSDIKSVGEKQLVIEQLDAELLDLGHDNAATGLDAYLDSIADEGDLETRANRLETEVKAAEVKLDRDARALKMASAAAVVDSTVPLDPVIARFRNDEAELKRRACSVKDELAKLQDDLASIRSDIMRLETRGEVPTKDVLSDRRNQRDKLWLAIRRCFMPGGGELTPTEPTPTAESYEVAVANADRVADELFSDAERATRYAEFHVRESQMEGALSLQQQQSESVQQEQAQLSKAWTELLAEHRLPSISILEAAQWTIERSAILQQARANQLKREEAKHGRATAQAIRDRIAELFQQIGEPTPTGTEELSEILARARGISKRHADHRVQRSVRKASRTAALVALNHNERAEADSRRKLTEWQTEWATAMEAIRLAGDASSDEATARIDQFAKVLEAHNALANAKTQRDKAQIRIQDYERRLGGIWERVRGQPLPFGESNHELRASDLYSDLAKTRTLQETLGTLTKQVADDRLAVQEAQQSAEHATAIIERLLRQANCNTLESLELVEGQSEHRTALAQEIHDIESRLVRSAGAPLADALHQAEGQEPDAVAETLDRIVRESDDNASLVQQRHETYLDAKQAFDAIDGSAAAAEAQQELANISARITELAAKYAASTLASALLKQVIDTYQERNKGPLVERASERFSAITSGRFSGVVIDYDEDKQILKAVRGDNERLTMEQLSTGRRDQLFLALRLAAIEGQLTNGEPLPLIVDDILMNFDDDAAAATFKVLAELSRRTQVLFLTHHDHLLDVASSAIGSDSFSEHRL